jgi:hypothetical protein
VWRLQGAGAPTLLVLLEVEDSDGQPGTTQLRLHAFDEAGTLLGVSEFTTGHRNYMSGFELKSLSVSRYPVLVISTGLGPGPGANLRGPNPRHQFYALLHHQWKLIRLEAEGELISASYHVKHFRCGPEVRPVDLAEVEKGIQSPDPSEVLAMLTWLGGFHQAPPAGEESPPYEDAKDVGMHIKAIHESRMRKLLEELAKSSHPWIRESAHFVLKK